jgi:hypothetical protein
MQNNACTGSNMVAVLSLPGLLHGSSKLALQS